jgi:hypothetical protein
MQAGGAAVDLAAGDPAEAGHFGVDGKRRFLLGDRQGGAQVLAARRDAQQLERGLDVGRPALAVVGGRRQQLHQLGAHLVGRALRAFDARLGRAAGEQEQEAGEGDGAWRGRGTCHGGECRGATS